MLVPSELDGRVAFCWALATELFGHSIAERGSLKRNGCENMQRMSVQHNCDGLWCSSVAPGCSKQNLFQCICFKRHSALQQKTVADWELSRKVKLSLRKTVSNHSNLKIIKKLDKELFTAHKSSIRTLKRNIMQPKWACRSQNGQHRMKDIWSTEKQKSLCNTQRNHQMMKEYNLTEMMDCVKTEVNIKL